MHKVLDIWNIRLVSALHSESYHDCPYSNKEQNKIIKYRFLVQSLYSNFYIYCYVNLKKKYQLIY